MLDAEGAMTDPQRWNRYVYVRNNPLRYTDPDGRDTLDLAIGFVVGIGRTAGNMVYAPSRAGHGFSRNDERGGQCDGH